MPLAGAGAVPFERVPAVRTFPSYRGQRNFPGLYYSATIDGHVGYESWLERDTLLALDHEAEVAGFSSQPFWLFWQGRDRVVSHAPDFFARSVDGTGIVIDCKPEGCIKPKDEAAFTATQKACTEMGWAFRLVTGHDPVWLANVWWLAGYRHRRYRLEPAVSRLLDAFAEAGPLVATAGLVGDPLAVLPVAFHLLWSGRLVTDLSCRLEAASLVWRAAP